MISEEVRMFASENNKGVLTTFRKNGAAQMSIIVCAPTDNGISFTTTEDRAKLRNLRRNSRCSLLISKEDWWGFMVLEGSAEIVDESSAGRDGWLEACRQVYRQISGEHPNWDEYDQAMIGDRRVVVTVVPDHVYGTAH